MGVQDEIVGGDSLAVNMQYLVNKTNGLLSYTENEGLCIKPVIQFKWFHHSMKRKQCRFFLHTEIPHDYRGFPV